MYLGFDDGVGLHTQILASVSWVIYAPEGQLVSLGGVCLQNSSNNVVEYNIMIELLRDSISNGIPSLEVHLNSQLVVSQLNGLYQVRDPTLLRRFLRVRLLQRQFDFITYIHIPRLYNHVFYSYANYN